MRGSGLPFRQLSPDHPVSPARAAGRWEFRTALFPDERPAKRANTSRIAALVARQSSRDVPSETSTTGTMRSPLLGPSTFAIALASLAAKRRAYPATRLKIGDCGACAMSRSGRSFSDTLSPMFYRPGFVALKGMTGTANTWAMISFGHASNVFSLPNQAGFS